MTTKDRLDLAANHNLAAALRAQARSSEGGECFELAGSVLSLGATRYPAAPFNAVLRTSRELSPSALLDRAEGIFARAKRRFSVYADADLAVECEARGYLASGRLCVMTLERPRRRAARPLAPELTWVTDAAGVARFASLATESFASVDVPGDAVRSAFSVPSELLERNLRMVIAHWAGRPSAAALSVGDGQSVGIYWVGTLPDARGRGLALACVSALVDAAFASGSRLVVLQASPLLAGLYNTLGFTTVSELQLYTNLRRLHATISIAN